MYTVFYTFQSQLVGCFSICINSLYVWSLFFSPCAMHGKKFILAKENWAFSMNQKIHLGLLLLPALFSIFLTKDTEKMVVLPFYLNTSCVNIGTSKLTQAVPQPIFDKILAVQKGRPYTCTAMCNNIQLLNVLAFMRDSSLLHCVCGLFKLCSKIK